MNKRICIIGSGGFAKEVYWLLIEAGFENAVDCFMEPDEYWQKKEVLGLPVKKQSEFNAEKNYAVIGIGDSKIREKVVYRQLPAETEYPVIIHPSARISKWVNIGRGSIICAGNIITCDISIGEFATINLGCTIGHDTIIGRFFTANPSVNISGSCTIGDFVNAGTNAAIRQGISICNDVVIGMGAIVIKDISEGGTYIGNPARLLSKQTKNLT